MLTEKSQETPAPSVHHAPAPAALDDLICYFEGEWVPMRDAKVSIMTHAFMYGTATFEGIRAYWNEDQGQLYGLKIREHVERIRQSCRILLMKNVPSVDELTRLVVETVRRNGFQQDAYIRPSFYKSTRAIGVRLHDLENELYIVALPFGNYIDTEEGCHVMTSSLATQRRRGAAGPGQDRRRIREHGLPEVRGRAQRLRRGDRADGRWPRERGVCCERVRRPRWRRIDATGQRRPARRRDPQGPDRAARQRGHPARGPLDRPVRAVRGRRDVPVRHRRPDLPGRSRSTIGRSARARSGRSAGSCATATSMRFAGGFRNTATG